jgi:hypothetical protein
MTADTSNGASQSDRLNLFFKRRTCRVPNSNLPQKFAVTGTTKNDCSQFGRLCLFATCLAKRLITEKRLRKLINHQLFFDGDEHLFKVAY